MNLLLRTIGAVGTAAATLATGTVLVSCDGQNVAGRMDEPTVLDAQTQLRAEVKQESACVDPLEGRVAVDADLHSEFFETSTSQYPWHIVVHPDGHLEDVIDGKIDAGDRVKVEHTAQCVSTHQGEHEMKFCDADLMKGGRLRLDLYGGLPAYGSSLEIFVDADGNVECSFSAAVKALWGEVKWRITKKEVRFLEEEVAAGKRLHGWISVEFEEIETLADGAERRQGHKIEGFIKPVVGDEGAQAAGKSG